MDDTIIWKMIDSYFHDNPQCLVRHHTESYNDFFKHSIFQIFKEKNPLEINTRFDKDINDFRSKCIMHFGGKDGKKIYFGKPIIYDDDNTHYMFPNEARLRNMTYGMTIHYDVDVEFIDILGAGESPTIIGLEQFEYDGGDEEDSDSANESGTSNLKKVKTNHRNKHVDSDGEKSIKEEDEDERRARIMAHGGSPKPQQRKRRVTKKLDVTPAQNALLREATEKSMINKNTQRRTITLEQIFLGKFPIMVQSDYCVLKGLPREIRHTMGECPNDLGGYFIIDGKEKTVITQEKFADNMLYIREVNDEHFLYSAEIRSVSENVSKPIRTLSVKMVSPSKSFTNKNIVVNIPNIRKPVPLFIVFRALGILSDKQIISMCLLDMNKYESMIDIFIPSVHDAGGIMTQRNALQYLALLTKGKTIAYVLEILSDYFLPHIGETNFIQKGYYLGYLVFRLLSVYTGIEQPTDRDNFKYKRLETVGSLMYDLFREYYTIQLKQIHLAFEEKISYNESLYANNLYGLIEQYHKDVFRERTVEIGFKKAFKGNWGAKSHTKRIGAIQDLNRLSFNSALSHLRKTNLPMDAGAKLVGPRVLHSTQWGLFDPIDTPDGANIGLHKHLSISTYITKGVSREPMLKWLREKVDMKLLEDCSPQMLSTMTKVILNGLWAGSIYEPIDTVRKIKLFRRNALIPIYTSVSFDIKQNTVFIYTDAGRLCRPIIYNDEETGKFSIENTKVLRRIKDDDFTWNQLITGFNERKIENFDPNTYGMYELHELYSNIDIESNPAKLQRFLDDKAVLDYIDPNESENILIAMNKEEVEKNKLNRYTHLEIHESLIFGVMCNLVNFPENNPATRNSFSCGQSKQAVSMYHTNHQVRMDKTAVVLVSGQTPLVKSRYLEHINHEQNPYGENAIVAIMCYTGYNVEDAILVNEGALKRGLFRTTYYSTYESHEEKEITADGKIEKLFMNIESESDVTGTKPGFDYSKLDRHGIIRENTLVDDKTVLIGLTATASSMKGVKMDMSKTPKKGQLGVVDKAFISESEEGKRIAKVRVREERIPNIGDKMACALPTQQVLTQLGWVEIKDIDISIHKVATLDKSGNMCYELPVNKFEYDHCGKMYYVKNKQVNVICTLNHKLYVKKRDKKIYELIEAENVVGKMVRFQKSMKNVYPDVEFIELGEKKYKMDDWLQLLGMFIADGSVNNRAVVLSAHKQRKVDFNIDFLTKLEIEYHHDIYNGYFALNIGKNKEIYNELKQYSLGALNKHLPEYVWKLSKRQCIILLEALMEGDGHTYKDGFSRYGTISHRLANDVSRLAVHCGWSGIIKIAEEPSEKSHIITGTLGYNKGKSHEISVKNTYYKISIIRKQNEPYINKKTNDSNEEKIIDYDGKVYCIEMPSSHLYYMRENNLAPSMLIGNSRAGQKGTIGLVIPEEDMPFTKDGLRPDLIINPHALPTRMTIGQLVECIIGKAAAQYGGYADCTAFINKGSKIGVFGELLPKVGFHSSGNEILYNGMTGEQLQTEIFIGPNYYMRLKHMVKDKINFRALGPRTALTKQPVAGRANDGGLRIGEMERDSVISHGAVNFLTESMMERGDKYYMSICNNTGMIAIYNPAKNIFMSPMADGPIRYVGSMDGKEMRIENVTRYGRSFSVICIPYSLKLLIQELQTVNIQMRIITEDNIEQLENMLYSKNMDKLLSKETSAKGLIQEIKEALSSKELGKNKLQTPEQEVEESPKIPEYEATSPEYAPYSPYVGEEITYADGSPAYNPTSPAYQPEYDPNSPQYNPESPQYYPNSPDEPPPGMGYSPHSPDEPPPKEFRAGENVYLRGGGDNKPDRLWTIKNIGDKFITIITEDMAGLNPQDSIKVVRPYELYKYLDYRPPAMPMMRGGFGMIPKQQYMQGSYQETPTISVNPVIKIMNGGSDFSNGQEQGVTAAPGEAEKMLPTITNTGGSGNPIIVKEQGQQQQSQEGGDIMGHLSKAGGLMIKKLGF